MRVFLKGQEFELLKEKALYKTGDSLLIIADVHLGKANHFRNSGIPLPAIAQMGDYANLEALLRKVNPEKVWFLGDLFHSTYNRDWHYFKELIGRFPDVAFTLIKGNHDLIDKQLFTDLCINVRDSAEDDNFLYTHEPLPDYKGAKLNISGHIHPGIVITGSGRQHLKLPCYYATAHQLILPAFGILTGLHSIPRTSGSRIFAVLPDGVREI